MSRQNRWAALALALCMMLTLAGCGSRSEPAPEPPAPSQPSVPSQPAEPAPSAPTLPEIPTVPAPAPDAPAQSGQGGYNTNDGIHTEKVEGAEPEKPKNLDGAKCRYCNVWMTDWTAAEEPCGALVEYTRSCTKCGDTLITRRMLWHTLENGSCTTCGKGESDPKKLYFTLNDQGTGYTLIRVTFNHQDADLIIPRMYQGLPVTGVKNLTMDRKDDLQPRYIYLPDTMTELGDEALRGSKFIQAVWMPDSITSVGRQALDGCQRVCALRMGSGVTDIGDYAFRSTALTELALPAGLRTIGTGAFMQCSALTGLDFGPVLERVGEAAFAQCRALERAMLPDSVTTILPTAFGSCEQLQQVHIPKNVTFIPNDCFYGCESLEKVIWHGDITAIDDSAFSKTVVTQLPLLPKLQQLGESAFQDCAAMTSAALPDGFIAVPKYAFRGCRALKTVTLPDSLLRIGEGAFEDCPVQPTVTPREVTNSDGFRCVNGHMMTDWMPYGRVLTCHDSITWKRFCPVCREEISKTQLKWHNMVEDVCTDCGVTAAPAELLQFRLNDGNTGYVFIGVTGGYESDTLIIPGAYRGLPVTEVEAFGKPANSWYKLRTVYVPEGVTAIHSNAAAGCNLYSLYLPDSLEQVPEELCTASTAKNLTDLRLGAGLKSIGTAAFTGSSLTGVTLPEGLEIIGVSAFRGQPLTWVELPQSLRRIEKMAFELCGELKYVLWPADLEYIGEGAFRGTGVSGLALPPVAELGADAFDK